MKDHDRASSVWATGTGKSRWRKFALVGGSITGVLLLSAFLLSSGALGAFGRKTAPHIDSGEKSDSAVAGGQPDLEAVVDVIALLEGSDIEDLCSALRVGGVSEELIRAIVRTKLDEKYKPLLEARNRDRADDRGAYWKSYSARSRAVYDVERLEVLRDRREEERRLLMSLHNDALANGKYAFLPADKRRMLSAIEADYGEMLSDLRARMAFYPLKVEEDTLRMLQQERLRDVETLLSPEERRMVELRTSEEAMLVGQQYGSFIESEEEFAAVYDLVKTGVPRAQVEEQVRAMLGPERSRQLALSRDPDVRALKLVAAKLSTSSDPMINDTLALRESAAQAAMRIMDDGLLDPDARRSAIKKLGQEVRTQLQKVLGDEVGNTFANRAIWTRALTHGSPFTVSSSGGVDIKRSASRHSE